MPLSGHCHRRTAESAGPPAAQSLEGGPYDAICFFDALHGMGDLVGALTHARERLAEGGVVFAVEPAAADQLEVIVRAGLATHREVARTMFNIVHEVRG